VIYIALIENYQENYRKICGYIRSSAICDDDYKNILEEFSKQDLKPDDINSEDFVRWLHFKADIQILKYYHQNRNDKDKDRKNEVRQKIRSTYEKIHNIYPEAFRKEDITGYFIPSELPSYFKLKKFFKHFSEAAYPHQTIAFCYNYLLDDWDAAKIVRELSKTSLDDCLDGFINCYSEQSRLPVFLINFYLISIKETLGKRLKNIFSSADRVTPVKMSKYLNWLTGWTQIELYYVNNSVHDVSDWCSKVRTRAIKNLIANI